MNNEIYDSCVDEYEKYKMKNMKSLESVFINPPHSKAIRSVEAYQQVLPPVMKMGRIFRLRKTKEAYQANGILLKRFIGMALLPLVDSPSKIGHVVKLLFGTNMYKRMMPNYVFPRKYMYRNPIIPGSKKVIKMNSIDEYDSIQKAILPSLTTMPSYLVKNLKNTIFDLTGILKYTLPNSEMCTRPQILKTSENLILQSILRLAFTDKAEDAYPLYSQFSMSLPPIYDNFKDIIIPFNVTCKDVRLANLWLNPDMKTFSNVIKRDPELSSHIGILQFMTKLLGEYPFENDLIGQTLSHFIKDGNSHIIFIFYNDTHAFYVDYDEYKSKEMKYDSIFRMIKTSLKLMISLNNGDITDKDVEDLKDDIDYANDADSEAVDTKVDETIKEKKDFDKELLNAVNEPTKPHHEVNRIEVGVVKSPEDKVVDKMNDNIDKISKMQKSLSDAIELGFTSEKNLINNAHVRKNNNETGDDRNPKDDSADNAAKQAVKVTTFVDKINSMKDSDDDEADIESEDDEEDTIDDTFDDDNGIGQDESPQNDEGQEQQTQEENEEDEEEDGESSEEDDEFFEDDKKKKESNAKTALIEHIRETTEGKMTDKQKKYYDSIKDKYKSIKFNENETLEDVLNRANTISIELHDEKLNLLDKSYNKSILTDFTKNYVKKTMAQDIIANVKAFSDGNKSNQMAIVGFEKKDISDQFNSMERYKFELKDKYGRSHHITFKMPKVDDDGFMYIGGNKKLIKKQWILKPVSKTSPDDVYVVSNYNKVHIFRTGVNVNRSTEAIDKFVKLYYTQPETFPKVSIFGGNNTKINLDYTTTIEYDFLAAKLDRMTVGNVDFVFSQKKIRDYIIDNKLKFDLEGVDVPIGIRNGNEIISVNPNDVSSSIADIILNELKNCDDNTEAAVIAAFNTTKADSRKIYSTIEVQSKKVPLVVFMSAIFSFNTVLEKSQVKYKFIPKGSKKNLSAEELEFIKPENDAACIKFADGTFYYKQHPIDNAMLFNGLKDLGCDEYNFEDLNHPETYIDYTFRKLAKRTLIKGWIAFRDLFLDPKTLEVIEALHLPTDLCELLLYANSLLKDNFYEFSGGVTSWRIRDYEILSDLMYQSISQNYAEYMKKGKSRDGFSIPEDDILTRLNKSLVLVNYDTTSPLSELREKGAVTYKGPNGINLDRAFSIDKRGVSEDTVGTVDIATVDNGSVGINKQLTANPRIINTLGLVEATKKEEIPKLSSSSLYSYEIAIPYGQYNDPRRIGFVSSQTKHLVSALSADVPVVGTGMEKALPYKVGDTFGYKAKQDGKVLVVDNDAKYVIVQYKDGTKDRIDFGGKYFKNSDFFLSNNLECNVKAGQTIKAGQIVTYNKDYFKWHMGKLIFCQGCMARVAFHEGEVTEDDSSAVSYRIAKKLSTTVIKRKQICLSHNVNIVSFVPIGTHVVYGDDLVVYEDAKDPDSDMTLLSLLGDADEDILNTISRHGASANYSGVVKDMKVIWTIDPDLMGESARKFVKQYINRIKAEIKKEEDVSGQPSKRRVEIQVSKPSGPMKDRINGVLCPKEGCIIIEYFIEHTADRRPGDKVALMPSLKSVINKVMPKELCAYRVNSYSKYNTIDYIQGTVGVMARMTVSQYIDGFLSKIIIEQGKKIAEQFLESVGEGK